MKIKTQITLSFFFIIVLITSVMIVFSLDTLKRFAKLRIDSNRTGISELARKNSETTKKILVDYCARIVKIDSESLVNELDPLLKRVASSPDAAEKIVAFLRYSSGAWNKDSSFSCVIDKDGRLVYPASLEVVENRLENIKKSKEWPDILKTIRYNNAFGEFRIMNKKGTEVLSCVVVKQFKDSGMLLLSAADVNSIVPVIQSQIAAPSEQVARDSEEYMRVLFGGMINHYRNISIVFGCMVLLFGLFYGVWFGNYICGPIRKLQDAMNEMQKGNLPQTLKVSGTEETRQITKSFNDLTTVLSRDHVAKVLSDKKN